MNLKDKILWHEYILELVWGSIFDRKWAFGGPLLYDNDSQNFVSETLLVIAVGRLFPIVTTKFSSYW